MKLVISAIDFAQLERALFASAPAEGAAFLAVEPDDDILRLRSYRVFQPGEIDGSAIGHIAINEEAQIRELAAIKRARAAAVEVHTHPGSHANVDFSRYDDEELPAFARYVQNKLLGQPFGAVVLGHAGYAGRAWTKARKQEELDLEVVGEHVALPAWARPDGSVTVPERYDRQVRALGPAAQRRIANLRVAVVGLGGTGSQGVQQLAHLGVRDFVLVDDDRVEETNLPRLAGAKWWDARLRRRKAAVARRTIRGLAPRARIESPGTLRTTAALRALRDVDAIIGCVDNDGARLILSETAATYLTPYLDLGVGIEESGASSSTAIGGRVAFYMPGGPCIACADELDFGEAAEDMEAEASHKIRVERGYARDRTVEPALMPLNTVIVGLGMIEFLAYFTGVRSVRSFYRYDAVSVSLVESHVHLNEDCPVCRPAHARGPRQQIERYVLDARTRPTQDTQA
jgi:molybdopterin/thiamine biosynthesis adenylyltransferase